MLWVLRAVLAQRTPTASPPSASCGTRAWPTKAKAFELVACLAAAEAAKPNTHGDTVSMGPSAHFHFSHVFLVTCFKCMRRFAAATGFNIGARTPQGSIFHISRAAVFEARSSL